MSIFSIKILRQTFYRSWWPQATCKFRTDLTWTVAIAWLRFFLRRVSWPDLTWAKNFTECPQSTSLKSQKLSVRYLQLFGNGTRKTWGGGASEAPPPPKIGLMMPHTQRNIADRPPPWSGVWCPLWSRAGSLHAPAVHSRYAVSSPWRSAWPARRPLAPPGIGGLTTADRRCPTGAAGGEAGWSRSREPARMAGVNAFWAMNERKSVLTA